MDHQDKERPRLGEESVSREDFQSAAGKAFLRKVEGAKLSEESQKTFGNHLRCLSKSSKSISNPFSRERKPRNRTATVASEAR